jgi:hypothetical protein
LLLLFAVLLLFVFIFSNEKKPTFCPPKKEKTTDGQDARPPLASPVLR